MVSNLIGMRASQYLVPIMASIAGKVRVDLVWTGGEVHACIACRNNEAVGCVTGVDWII